MEAEAHKMVDPDSALRAEMQAALDALDPEVRGLQELAAISVSSSEKIAVSTQIDVRTRRRDLIHAVLAALDAVVASRAALAADGYPDMPKAVVFGPVFDAIQAQSSDIALAAGLFVSENVPTAISLDLLNAELNPQPKPVT
jgi:hypothetical protein